jgi:hypothetical protein
VIDEKKLKDVLDMLAQELKTNCQKNLIKKEERKNE